MTEVYMIRRLIEDEESWFLYGELTEHDESFLSLGEGSDRSRHDLTRDEKSTCERAKVFVEHFSI